MDRERCAEILVSYGVGPCMLRLINYFWDKAVLVCRAKGRKGQHRTDPSHLRFST
jgi:hypothetical protein